MFFTILSYIFVFALGGAIGSAVVSWNSVREAEKMEKRYNQSIKMKDNLLDTAMKTGGYFERRCDQLEKELDYYKNGGGSTHGVDV